MNEISDFVNSSRDGCPNVALEHPSYLPGNRSLKEKTLCMTAKHYAGERANVYNMYDLCMAVATNL